MTPAELTAWLVARLAKVTGQPAPLIAVDRPLRDLGVSSRDAVGVAGELGELLGRSLPATLVYRHPSIAELVAALLEPGTTGAREKAPAPGEPIAVVGIGCRLPHGIETPEAFWDLLIGERSVIGSRPEGREGPDEPGGYLDDVAGFDAEFFGISPREAAVADPQQRIVLEVAWSALDHAGMAPGSLGGSRTGVYLGVSSAEYGALRMTDPAQLDAWSGTGAAASVIANRLSYQLDLRGPSVVVDTACSSSLVAVHQALAGLRSGECDLALAGGVNLLLAEGPFATFRHAGLLAPDARCKAFDAAADGIVRGEGCGVVVLRRLSDARAAGDRILAVLRGSAVNSDGRSNGLMAPNPAAQAELLRSAYAAAGVDPSTVDYVEAHGTGTALGDPIEAGALGAELGDGRPGSAPLLVGSVKTNLGHLEGAAGVAGLIKVVLALGRGVVPAGLHFREPSPHIDFAAARLNVVTKPRPWPRYSGLATAGVSAFGFGGANAHVVVEEWPAGPVPAASTSGTELFAVSARTADRLAESAADLAKWIAGSDVPLSEVAAALARRRDHEPARAVVRARDRQSLVDGLRAVADQAPASQVVTGTARPDAAAPVFVFSGHGSAWPGMGAQLLDTEPAFAEAVAEQEPHFLSTVGFSLREVLCSPGPPSDLNVVQPALFGMQVALARFWQACGVRPAAVLGHSMGEVAAAVVAGALDVPSGLLVMRERARLLAGLDTAGAGAMAVVDLPPEEVSFPGLTVAVHGSPAQCTVAGTREAVAAFVGNVTASGGFARVLPIGGAAHTAAVAPGLAAFRTAIGSLTSASPTVPVLSSVLDDPAAEPKFDPEYWAANLRRPVRFRQAVEAAVERGHRVFLEISPHPVVLSAIEQTADVLTLAAMRRDGEGCLPALAALHVAGHASALLARYPAAPVVDLPARRWRHVRHWATATPGSARHPLLGEHVEVPGEDRHLWQAEVSTTRLPWLADHAVDGTPVFPATGFAELALAAGGRALRDVAFDALLDLSAPVTLTTVLTGDRVEVLARTGGAWVRHARATVVRGDDPPPVPLKSFGGAELDLHARFAAAGYGYGPAFRGVRAAHADEGSAWAVVELPDEARSHPAYVLHPALADACLQVLAAAAPQGTPDPYLPVGIGSVRVLGDPARGTKCAAVLTESTEDTVVGTVQLQADDGEVLAEFAGVRATRPRPATTVLEPRWEPVSLPQRAGTPRTWSSVSEVDEPELVAAFAEAGVTRAGTGDDVVFVAGPADDPVQAQRLLLRVVDVVRALAGSRSRLWLVTRGAHAVLPGERGKPGLASLRALVRVLAFEHPELRATQVDVESMAEAVAEVCAGQPEDEVAWRDGQRYAARLSRVALMPGDVPVRPGAYLITGGLGELGLYVAEWLVRRGATRLVLSGRSAPADPDVLDRLRTAGAEVDMVLGDLASTGVAEHLVARAQRGGVPLRGVVHGAGVLADRTVAELSREELARAWRPKALGGLRLHHATAEVELDWWLAQSSLAGLVGSPGQAAHATANAWLDALVAERRALGLPATTINWAAWTRPERDGRTNATLAQVEPQAALDALGAVLADGRAAAGVVQGGWTKAFDAFPALATRPFLADLVPQRADDTWAGLAAVRALPSGAARTAVRKRLFDRIAGLLGIREVDERVPLTSLGLDSLMAMRLRTALLNDFGVQQLAALLLRGASPAEVADAIAAELGIGSAPRPVPATVGPRDPAERWIARLWEGILGRDDVSVHEEFGGSPEQADRLRAAVAERLGVAPAELFDNPTVAAMADLVRPDLTESPEPVRVLGTGDGPPLHLFHPAGSSTSVYQPLAAELGRPCLGYERVDDLDSVEDKAAHYADLVRERQPSGPYTLGGWSFGGCLAYETAQVLAVRGEEVRRVVLADTILPLSTEDKPEARFHRFAQHVERTYGVELNLPDLAAADDDERIRLVLDRVRAAVPGIGEAVLHHQYTSYVDARLAERYVPRPWPGPVLLLRAADSHALTTTLDPRYRRTDEALGWDAFCPQLRVVRVPGDHVSMIDPPHVAVLAARLAEAL